SPHHLLCLYSIPTRRSSDLARATQADNVPATRPHTHLPTQIIWQPANQTTAPAHINDWLLHPGSLTQRLRQHGEFTVLPQHEWRSEEHTSELQSRFDVVCRI